MNLFLTFILCIIINLASRVIIKKCQELYSLFKLKKQVNEIDNLDISKLNLNNEFWSNLKNEDLSSDRDN